MLKSYSPMSIGSWGVLLFGAFSFLSFLGRPRRVGRRPDGRLCASARPRHRSAASSPCLGGIFGFFVAGYTGVLLAVTNRPDLGRHDAARAQLPDLGASTAAALLILLGGADAIRLTGLHALERFDGWLLVFELVALIALVFSLGEIARLWLGWWGALLVFGVVGLGIVVPLLMFWRPRTVRPTRGPIAAVLVLVGGFLLRVVVILSSEGA